MGVRTAAWLLAALWLAPATARADRTTIRCDNLSTADVVVDGVLDDWGKQVLGRAGTPGDGSIELRCSWDGTALAVALDIKDDRVVRVRGKGAEDRVDITITAGGRPVRASVLPSNNIAKSKVSVPARCAVADSQQPKGFSIEARCPASALPGLSSATPSLELSIKYSDSDQATGGDTTDVALDATIELGDRKDLLDDFLKTVKLRRTDVRLDTLAELDPSRKGKERIVAGGTVIGVLTDQFAYVALPAAKPTDVKKVELVPLGARGEQIVSAVIRQSGNGGSRDLLMLWSVAGGQLQPLAQIEVKKELGANVLESTWRLVKGTKATELWLEPKPAVGFTADTWNEIPAPDSDGILLPWDNARGGVAYSIKGAELVRRDLPVKKR
ncbi:MAG TPA: hypothetical protein VFQ53_00415 [Kofleriaceae bacterium]|nr:hypothetical protein [Kofleriaceae bacterium]